MRPNQRLDIIIGPCTQLRENSIGLLQAHLKKGTCPKSLRYNAIVNIAFEKDFKSDI